jgi:hypothetical protein
MSDEPGGSMFDYDARPVTRAREAYGVPSGVNNVLIINRAIAPNRISAVLVRQSLGF